MAAELPGDLGQAVLLPRKAPHAYRRDQFLRQLAHETSGTEENAQHDARAVLTTLAQALTGEELNLVITQLPRGYVDLFGKPAPSPQRQGRP